MVVGARPITVGHFVLVGRFGRQKRLGNKDVR